MLSFNWLKLQYDFHGTCHLHFDIFCCIFLFFSPNIRFPLIILARLHQIKSGRGNKTSKRDLQQKQKQFICNNRCIGNYCMHATFLMCHLYKHSTWNNVSLMCKKRWSKPTIYTENTRNDWLQQIAMWNHSHELNFKFPMLLF